MPFDWEKQGRESLKGIVEISYKDSMKLIITGGSGFIGSNFIHYWFEKHPRDEILNLDALTYAANEGVNEELREKFSYYHRTGDISNSYVVDDLPKDYDLVVNFAAETHVDNSIVNSKNFVRSNIVGIHKVLEFCRKYDLRLHQISTDEVFGSLPLESKDKFNEDSKYSPSNPYSATKASGDHLVEAYWKTYSLRGTVSNCSNNFGPFQNVEKLIPKTITNSLKNLKVPLYGNGTQVRNWIYVRDHCSAIEKIIEKGRNGEFYNIGGDTEISNKELVKLILHMLNRTDNLIEYVNDRPGHDVHYSMDSSKLRQELGWAPTFTLEAGLQKTIQFYREALKSTI